MAGFARGGPRRILDGSRDLCGVGMTPRRDSAPHGSPQSHERGSGGGECPREGSEGSQTTSGCRWQVDVHVPGKPAPQGSKRHLGRGILVESSKEVGAWRERIALTAHNAMTGQPPTTQAVSVTLQFAMPRPKSTPRSSTPLAVKRPDIDKLARACLDAITNVVIADDSQVVAMWVTKRIADHDEQPGMRMTVQHMTPPNPAEYFRRTRRDTQ